MSQLGGLFQLGAKYLFEAVYLQVPQPPCAILSGAMSRARSEKREIIHPYLSANAV